MKKLLSLLLAAALAVSAAGCAGSSSSTAPSQSASSEAGASSAAPAASNAEGQAPTDGAGQSLPALRAVWVSYLEWEHMDFSSEEAFTADVATLMDNCAQLGLNAVIAQVRPFADALYPSELFPWSSYCTGTQGIDPGFDPLAILVEQAHARGLQLHAWINPYRISNSAETPGALAGNSVAFYHPEWVRAVGDAQYLDPSSPEVMDYITEGVLEILNNYAVDGIQFDDYFYPTTDPAFDEADYAAFTEGGGSLSLDEWRRQNVNTLVAQVYAAVKDAAPQVVFGISPQGNNDNNYNGQYSDVALWMSTPGYLDYVMPQTYWGYHYTLSGGSDRFAFENITAEWAAMERAEGVALYFGLGAYRIGEGDGGSNADSVEGWNTGHTLADMAADIKALGADGYALYRYDFLFKNDAYASLAEAECAALQAQNAG